MRRVICGSGSPLSAQGKGRGQEYSMRKKGIIPGLCLTAACLLLAACGGPDGNAEGAGESGMGAAADSRVMTGLPDIPAGVPEGRQEDLMEPEPSQEADPKEMLTFERLQELIQEPVPLLEHYARYQDIGGESEGTIRYPIQDPVSGADMVLHIRFRTEDNQIDHMYLYRRNDFFHCGIYYDNSGLPGYVSDAASRLEHYREDVGELFHWIKGYEFPDLIYIRIRPWQFRADMGPGDWKGQTYWCVGEGPEEDKDSDGEPPEWKAVLGIMQIPQEYLVFADGKLQEVGQMYDQAELTMGYEPLEGCGEQAVIWKISARLYAQTENEKTEDFWYVCFGREDSPQGYIAAMNCRYFSWEDAIAFVKSIQFHDAAWQ